MNESFDIYKAEWNILCDNTNIMTIMKANVDLNYTQYIQFWLILICITSGRIGRSMVITMADTLCFRLLGMGCFFLFFWSIKCK